MESKAVRSSHELANLIAATNTRTIIQSLPVGKRFTVGILIADYNHSDPHSGVAFGKVRICGDTILVEMPRNNIVVFPTSTVTDEFFYVASDRSRGLRSLGTADVKEVLQEILMADNNNGGSDLFGTLVWHEEIYEQKRANIVARASGFGRATEYEYGTEDKILRSTPYGYRKYTTGEYVSSAYRSAFGWKNTYYQHAECIVQIKE